MIELGIDEFLTTPGRIYPYCHQMDFPYFQNDGRYRRVSRTRRGLTLDPTFQIHVKSDALEVGPITMSNIMAILIKAIQFFLDPS
jgi:hypothetical protein